jgi:hypothetical protein
MQQFSIVSRGLSAAAVSLMLFASACTCKPSTLGTNYGEIGVIWRDDTGTQVSNRDATYDFGNALSGDTKTLTMTVKNNGTAKLTLSKLVVASGDAVNIGDATAAGSPFTVKFKPSDVNPTEQVEFEMSFTPQELKSTFLAVLTLTGEGARPEDSTATITLKGGGEKGACELPDTIDFGAVQVGETQTFSLDMYNPTTLPATATAGDFTGADATSFAYPGPHGSVVVAPKTTVPVLVAFSPTEKRSYSASIVAHGPGNCPDKTITLTGRGGDETLTWKPTDSLAFGFVNPGSDSVRQVVFTNPSNVPITLTQVVTTMPSDFFQRVDAGKDETKFVVAGGGTSSLNLTCSPSGLGARSAKVTFNTGLKKVPSGSINLTCTGGGPKIKVTPRPTLGFGRVGYFANSSVNRKVTVQNVGGKPPVPDITANLFLGQVVNSLPGQGTPFEIVAGPNTDATEFSIGLGSAYDGARGIEATPGSNFVDFLVTLKPASVGMKSAKLTIYSNDPTEPVITIDITADVQNLPPCNYEVTPTMVSYGLVTPGISKDLPVTITNKGTGPNDICYLSGIDLAAGTSPAFTLVGGPVDAKQLAPGESWQVVVRLSPVGPVPTTLTTLTGTLRFNASAPGPTPPPTANVQLSASIGPSCLAVTPDPQDFGTTKIGCNSVSRTFNIYNICQQPIQLSTIALQAAAGQPAGGPNCTGGTACPEFFLSSTPTPNTTVSPGAAPVQFQAKYRPIDVGSDSGAIALNVIQSGQTVTYLVGLVGKGDTVGQQTDTFVQDAQPKADILIVVDDSGSMADKQASLAANFNSFIKYAASAMVDYQIGVTSTTKTNAGDQVCLPVLGCQTSPGANSIAPGGLLHRDPAKGLAPILTPMTRNVPQTFANLVNLGTDGSGVEQGLEAATLALTPPMIAGDNLGFLRPEANLAVVVISDAGDQSPQSVTYYQNRLINIKGFNRLSMFTFNNIGPYQPTDSAACQYDNDHNPERYAAVVDATSGVKDEICTTSWATALQALGRTAFGFRTQFFLNNTPDQTAGKLLEVKVNGAISPGTAWLYDSGTNSIKFNPTDAPAPGQSLTVRYDTQCL